MANPNNSTVSVAFGIHPAVTALMQINVLWLAEAILGAILGDAVLFQGQVGLMTGSEWKT